MQENPGEKTENYYLRVRFEEGRVEKLAIELTAIVKYRNICLFSRVYAKIVEG